jgi:hypothetical protein
MRSSLNGEIGNLLVARRKPVTVEIGMGRSVAVTLISVSSSAADSDIDLLRISARIAFTIVPSEGIPSKLGTS